MEGPFQGGKGGNSSEAGAKCPSARIALSSFYPVAEGLEELAYYEWGASTFASITFDCRIIPSSERQIQGRFNDAFATEHFSWPQTTSHLRQAH